MGIRGALLEHDSERSKEQDLHSRTRGIPERARNAVSVTNARTLEESGRPSPGGDNGGCDEARLHRAASRGEHFRGLNLAIEALEDMRERDLQFMLVRRLMRCFFFFGVEELTMKIAKAMPTPKTMP